MVSHIEVGRGEFGVDDLFVALDVNKAEWLGDIEKGYSSLKAMVEDERECKKFVKGISSKN